MDGETGTGTDNRGMARARIQSFVQLLMPSVLACHGRPQQNKNAGLQEILTTERLDKWGDLNKKHCQPRQYLKRKTKHIKVMDGLPDVGPKDNNDGEYQTDTADTSKSEADNASDNAISNGEVSVRSLVVFAFGLISI